MKSSKHRGRQKTLFGFEDESRRNKFKNSMHVVDDLRVSPFMPIDKVSTRSRIYKNFVANNNVLVRNTSWGKVEIRSRLLTQKHLEIFSSIMARKKHFKKILNSDGKPAVAIYFSLSDIADQLALSYGGWTQRFLEEKIKEMYDVSIVRHFNNGDQYPYRLITHFEYKASDDLWGIILDPEYTSFFEQTLTIDYSKRLDEIISISGEGAALIRAIIQHLITHRIKEGEYQRISLIQILETVGYETDDRMLRRAITAINKYSDKLNDFGIRYYKKDRIFEYSGTKDITFTPPLSILK